MRKNLKYILPLAAGLAGLILVEWFRPAPLDWSASFSGNDKIPFGSYVLFQMLPEIFPGEMIAVATLPIYNTLGDEAGGGRNYLFVNETFAGDELDAKKLLDFAAAGNSVFIAANWFRGRLADTLKLKTDLHVVFNDSISINFVNPALLNAADYIYKKQFVSHFFTGFDSSRTVVLGVDNKGKINFIKTTFGAGEFFLNTAPLAFTNYNMLYRNNAEYVYKALSYLPVQATIWDEYYKAGRRKMQTPLRYVMSQEPLRWAYYVALAGVLLFIFFAGRRRQRLIPVIAPKANTTLVFVETVGRLYFQHGDHKNIAEKKIAHFLDHVRSHYYLKTSPLDQELGEKLAKKSGIEIDAINGLFKKIESVHAKTQIEETELIALNGAIERFYKLTNAQE